MTTNIVVVNVSVLDRNGKPMENLTKDDFLVYEDGKLQKLQAVDLQRLKNDVLPPVQQTCKSARSQSSLRRARQRQLLILRASIRTGV